MPTLFLIPNTISAEGRIFLSEEVLRRIKHLRVFFAEEAKSCRRLLKALDADFPLKDCRFLDLNEHSSLQTIRSYAAIITKEDCAIVSEAGCPCVADPGADLVLLAHQHNVEIMPLVGPSSIVLALMASGLSGQHFAFHGYLSREKPQRGQQIKFLEERSFKERQAQIFMEAPYRNQTLWEDILSACKDHTLLCVAADLTGPKQNIKTKKIKEWKKDPIHIEKTPALFIIQSL